MANYNKVVLMGNLTRDPELKYTPGGQPLATTGLAVNRKYRGADEQLREEVTFVDLTVFGKQAETLARFLKKGAPLLVDGRLHWHSWENDKGERRSKLDVVAERFHFLPRREGGDGRGLESPFDDEVAAVQN